MPISIDIYEDTGPLLTGHGTTRTIVTNCNWKNSGVVEAAYYIEPLRRPDTDDDWKCSFTKYLYFKISGTFVKAKNFKIEISAAPGLNTLLYGRMTHEYKAPSSALDGKMMLINGPQTFYPMIGLDPSTAQELDPVISTGTYYTAYLATQLRVINSISTDVGNTAALTIKFLLSEYE